MNRSRPVAALLAALAALLVMTAPAVADDQGGDDLSQQIDGDQRVSRDDAVLDLGHVDLGPRYLDDAWTLMVHDDTDLDGSVWRPLEHAVVRVRDTAQLTVPDDPAYDFLGVPAGQPVHVVPQTQDQQVVWLGWNTQDPQVMETVDRGVTLSLEALDGPGELVVYLQDGGFGDPDVLWDSRETAEQPLWVDVNTHTHANWVFTEPGVYLVAIRATAALVDGSEETTVGTVRFAVGDRTDPQEALAAQATVEPDAAPASDTPEADDAAEAADGSDDAGGGGVPVAVWFGVALAVLAALGVGLALRGRRVRDRALGDR